MAVIIFKCKTCNKYNVRDIYSNIVEPINSFKLAHIGHDLDIRFADTVPERFRCRPMTKYIAWKWNGTPLVGAEIGVKYGDNAFNLLGMLNMKKLYLIDPYEFYKGYDKSDFKVNNPDDTYDKAKELLMQYKKRIKFIRKKSKKALEQVPNELDFVYVDGNHQYDYVLEDLELYYKKLKIGGIIGGHDFGLHTPDVVRAVSDFIYKHQLTDLHSENIDFWIIKDKEI